MLWYFLVSGELTFMTGESEVGITRTNTIIAHESPNLPLKLLGKANQSLAVTLAKELNDPNTQVAKITLIAISPLGQHTQADFYKGVENVVLSDAPANEG